MIIFTWGKLMNELAKPSANAHYLGYLIGRTFRASTFWKQWLIESSILTYVPTRIRGVVVVLTELVALFMVVVVALCFILVAGCILVLALLPVSFDSDEFPTADDLDHPLHRTHYPEFYDEYGSLK